MRTQKDKKGQLFVEWAQGPNGFKQAWIRRPVPGKDWAGTGRYVNVVRISALGGGPAGNSTDFPIFIPEHQKSDTDILSDFVTAACKTTGCPVPP